MIDVPCVSEYRERVDPMSTRASSRACQRDARVILSIFVEQFATRLVRLTEWILTARLRRKARRRLKQKNKNVVLDWIEAFLQAALLVLLINQYLLQAYQIPSGSMIRTLLLGDRIFVNKIVYGPELLPGVMKLPGFAVPQREEVIIFENPSYIGRGTLFTIVQRVLYMVTLSLVDIDRDENGQPRAQLLIKRAVGTEGDRFRIRHGEMLIRAAGSDTYIDERRFREESGASYPIQRTLLETDYDIIDAGGRALARDQLGLTSPARSNRRSRTCVRSVLVIRLRWSARARGIATPRNRTT